MDLKQKEKQKNNKLKTVKIIMTDNNHTSEKNKTWKKPLFISLAILLTGGIITAIIFFTEPEAKRGGATKETAMLVDVITAKRDTFQPTVEAMGTVRPSQEITLSARVKGEITNRTEEFTPGSIIKKGTTLLQIDPSDYRNNLQLRESELRQYIADLKIEMGRQNVAEKDYQLLDETLSEEQEDLILRTPQLNAARANVEAARASVEQAKLDLQRTTIKAPFDAQVLSRNVNIGSQVSEGQNLGRLVGIETYWIEATVPLAKVRWLSFPDNQDSNGSKVKVRNRTAWNQGEYRIGRLYKLVGTMEEKTRMARVLITVSDPLAHKKDDPEKPAMMIGSFVEANINAKVIPDVIRLNRDYVRKNETVWVMKNEKLEIKDVEIIFRDSKYAYITEGLKESDKIVTTNLTTVVEGSPLRVDSDSTQRESNTTDSFQTN